VKWEEIDKNKYEHGIYGMFLSYFDINNDGVEEGVFLLKLSHKSQFTDIVYMTKDNVDKVIFAEQKYRMFDKYKLGYLNYPSCLGLFCLPFDNEVDKEKDEAIWLPQDYPMVLNKKYYIAIFGIDTNKYFSTESLPYYFTNKWNKVDLVMINPDNKVEGICILTRFVVNNTK
jgi:hypothetical protein